MFWIAVKGFDNNQAISLGTAEQYEAELYGMHGYPTQAEAQANPNTVNALNRVQVEAWFANAQGVTLPQALATGAKDATQSVLGNGWNLVVGNTSGLGGRILKVIIGGILIIAGLFRMTGAKDIVTTAAKAAV